MGSPIIDKEMNEKDWKKIDRKLARKADSANSKPVSTDNTYYGLNKLEEKKDNKFLWRMIVLLISVSALIFIIWILSGILSGKLDLFGLFKKITNN